MPRFEGGLEEGQDQKLEQFKQTWLEAAADLAKLAEQVQSRNEDEASLAAGRYNAMLEEVQKAWEQYYSAGIDKAAAEAGL